MAHNDKQSFSYGMFSFDGSPNVNYYFGPWDSLPTAETQIKRASGLDNIPLGTVVALNSGNLYLRTNSNWDKIILESALTTLKSLVSLLLTDVAELKGTTPSTPEEPAEELPTQTKVRSLSSIDTGLSSYEELTIYEDIPEDYTNPVLVGYDDPDGCIQSAVIENGQVKLVINENTEAYVKDYTLYIANEGSFNVFKESLLMGSKKLNESITATSPIQITGLYEYAYDGTKKVEGDIIASNAYQTTIEVNGSEISLPYIITPTATNTTYTFNIKHATLTYTITLDVQNTESKCGNSLTLFNMQNGTFTSDNILNSVTTTTLNNGYYLLDVPEVKSNYWYIGIPSHMSLTETSITDGENNYNLGSADNVFIGDTEFKVYLILNILTANKTLYIR